jgi:hypothetical protein
MSTRSVVEVKLVDGELRRQWCIDWHIQDGVLTVRRENDKFTTYAKGKWVYAADVDPT